MNDYVNGAGTITRSGVFLYPKEKDLTAEDLDYMIQYHYSTLRPELERKMMGYLGKHKILEGARDLYRPDNRLVANIGSYIVDTYDGYFDSIPPKITLTNSSANEKLQDWNQRNSFSDILSEVARNASIYGRGYLLAYQNEDSETKVAVMGPENSFMIYDDTIAGNRIGFVTYDYYNGTKLNGTYYDATGIYPFVDKVNFNQKTANVYGLVPAVEFIENTERQGVLDGVQTLLDSLDKQLSQKANQIEYFDNAYLKILGLNLPEDSDGKPVANIAGNQLIYDPEADPDAVVDFIQKPDGDNMQEHSLDRLTSLIYQISKVPNPNDESFGGNITGVAIKQKMQSMAQMAGNKERKFTEALRSFYKVIFSTGKIVGKDTDLWHELQFQFTFNDIHNWSDEADTLSKLGAEVSQETALKTASFIDDPQAELKRLAKESKQRAKTDAQNREVFKANGVDDEE